MKKNLILGLLDNYTFHEVKKFVFSLQRTGYDGDTCLFLGSKTSPRTVRMLEKNGIKVSRFHNLNSLPDGNLALRSFKLPKPINYFNYRHFLYLDYLMRNGSNYENVMLTDVRDVFFQKDPFAFDLGDALYCALEGESVKIKDCSYNGPWVEFIFGPDVLKKIGDELISCAGTTWGKTEVITDYLSKMLSYVEDLPDAKKAIDQAIHNYLIRDNRFDKVCFLRNNEGVVLTLSYEENYRISDFDKICVDGDIIVGTIHQFPRRPDLVQLTDRLFLSSPIKNFVFRNLYRCDHLVHKLLIRLRLRRTTYGDDL